jgi:thiamine-monophosphate kinase
MPDEPGESRVIATLLTGRFTAQDPPPVVDVGDDVAVLPSRMAVGADLMVEGVHWDARLSAEDVGWKLVAVNASDLGATGARPTWATLSLALPRPLDHQWVEAFAVGMHAALHHWRITLVGGDTTRSPGPRFAGMTMGGPTLHPALRSGAGAGDTLWVTGTLGDAAHGFTHGGDGLAWLRRPRPPIAFALALAEARAVTAMLDLSDGLARDLPQLCAASGCGAEVDPAALPATPAVAHAADRLSLQTSFGDDYQLLFAAAPTSARRVEALARTHNVRVTPIGSCTPTGPAHLLGCPWPAASFAHFEGAA